MVHPEVKILRDKLAGSIGANGKLIRIIKGKDMIIEIQSERITRLETDKTELKIILAARDVEVKSLKNRLRYYESPHTPTITELHSEDEKSRKEKGKRHSSEAGGAGTQENPTTEGLAK